METVDDLIDDAPETVATEPSAPEPEKEQYGLPDEEYQPEPGPGDDTSAKATVEEPKAAEPSDAGDGFDEQLLADAEMVGFTRGEALSMGPAALEKSVRVALRNQALARREATERMAREPEPEPFDVKLDLDTSEYDEKLVGEVNAAFQKMKQHFEGQLAAVREQTSRAAQHAMQAENEARSRFEREFTAKFDNDLASLGMDEVFGKGAIADISKARDDASFQNRMRVLDHMEMDAERYLRRGERPPAQDVLFQRAVRAEFGDKLQQKQQQQLSEKIEKRATQLVPRAGSSPKAKQATGFAAVRDKYREILGREAEAHSIDEMVEA